MSKPKDSVQIHGFFRVQIGEEKKGKNGEITTEIKGDSGWQKNQIVNLGFQDYICAAIGAVAGSKQISNMGLGTGTAPASNATDIAGELSGGAYARKTTTNSVVTSRTLRCVASWASSEHPGGTPTIQNVGLYNTSATGTIACGNTYATSQWQSNQAVSVTYELRCS